MENLIKTIILTLALFILNFCAIEIFGQNLTNKISHISGSLIINGTEVTVNHSGTTDTITTYCTDVTSPYLIGASYPHFHGTGEYTFTFNPPVDSLLLNFSGISNISNDVEEIYLKVNGLHYSIPEIGVSNTCNPFAKLTSSGGIAGCRECNVSGWAGTIIPVSISSISIQDTVISGFPGGSVFSIYFYNDTTTRTNNYRIENDILVYPNPVVNDLFIKQSKTDHLDISLFNINGENVDINLEYFNDNIFANLTNLHSGLYCIRISNDKSSITKVLIKE